jgi:hypothetical protein
MRAFLNLVAFVSLVGCSSNPTLPERCPAASGDQCKAAFEPRLAPEVYEARYIELYQTMSQANLRYPQVGNGINLTVLGKFLEKPFPAALLLRPPPLDVVEKEYEAMLRAHEAYGIKVEVGREKVLANAKYFRDQLRTSLLKVIKLGDPEFLERSSGEALLDGFFVDGKPQHAEHSAKVAAKIKTVMTSSEVVAAAKEYREALRGRAGERNTHIISEFIAKLRARIDKEFPENERDSSFCLFMKGQWR